MGVIRIFTRGFINAFGITQPTPKQEQQASWFICGLLVLIILVSAAVFGVLMFGLRR